MSEKRMRNISILLILSFVFTVHYFAQGGWIVWLKADGQIKVDKCLALKNDKDKVKCLTEYIEYRNETAIMGVNGYLISIVGLLGVSVFRIYQARKRRRKEKNVRCECD